MAMDQADGGVDRRRFPRIPSEHVVLVTRVGDEALEQLGRTRDLSLGGCMFSADRAYGVGCLLQLLIKFDDGVIDALARVVHEEPRGSGEIELGAEFIYLSDQELITRLYG
jgi:hypothetical protein